jgi:hypothetical protein
MATVVARPDRSETDPAKKVRALPGRRYDSVFFSAMAWLLLATVFLGFAPTYYLAGVFHAPLQSLMIHVHGAVFSCWILLLVTQTALVSAGRVDLHRSLGMAGFVLACLMVVLGVAAAIDTLLRNIGPPGRDPQNFFIVPLTDMLIFASLVYFAYRKRFDPAAHKRLILIATIGTAVAAIARWPIVHKTPGRGSLVSYIFLAMLVAYDLWSTHRVHRATIWASAFMVFVQQIRGPIGHTATWHSFAGWVQSLAR